MDDLEKLLRARFRQDAPEVPADLDAAIVGLGHEAAAGHVRRRRRLRLVRIGSVAAAAAIVALCWLGTRALDEPRTLDVADAWRVARGLADPDETARLDLTGDGRLDAADADRILDRVVSLRPRRDR